MVTRLIPPQLGRLDERNEEISAPTLKPNLRTVSRHSTPRIESVITQGFVAEAEIPVQRDPGETMEGLTIEVPRRLKRALLAEVAARRDDPERRASASMKSVILEALATTGFGEFINRTDIEVQSGIFMKRQSARLKRN